MFGSKKAAKTHRQWKDAPDPGTVEIIPDARPDAGSVNAVLRRVLAEVGGEAVPGFDVTAEATTEPLTFTVDGLWLRSVDEDLADTTLNRWNVGHTVPRAHAELDAEGRVRVRADSQLVCGAGVTIRQLDEWVRRALAGFTALGDFLGQRWPDAEIVEGAGQVTSAGQEAPTADGDITALVTPGNRHGLLGGRTPAVLLPRLGDGTEIKEPGASGRRGNGYMRFDVGPSVALHDGTLTVTDGVELGTLDLDTAEWLHRLCGRMNALSGGVVSVVEGTSLTCAVHRPVGSGLSDAQLADAVSRDRAAVAETLGILLAEVTGEGADA